MRTYYIFNVNRYFSYMYKNKPFKMYKMFEEIYYSKSYDSLNTYRNFETVAVPFNKIMLNEYIYYEFKLKYGYKRNGNKHNLKPIGAMASFTLSGLSIFILPFKINSQMFL